MESKLTVSSISANTVENERRDSIHGNNFLEFYTVRKTLVDHERELVDHTPGLLGQGQKSLRTHVQLNGSSVDEKIFRRP